jgi:hypothetical protein
MTERDAQADAAVAESRLAPSLQGHICNPSILQSRLDRIGKTSRSERHSSPPINTSSKVT